MQQILSVWSSLDVRRQVIVAVASLAMFAAILGLSRMAATPNMTLLYAGLESGPAGEIISSLEQSGVLHEIRGDSIFVPEPQRDALRMTLAGQGLPSTSSKGYEILDGLSGFGTTSQMFDAAYWRAKEGELARTITASPHVRSARVHISNAHSSAFQRGSTITASVTVTSVGGSLSTTHAKALKYLIASAVSGLLPEEVSVIDGQGGLISGADDQTAPLGDDKAETLRKRVERILEARVGYGNAVVEVSVDTVTETESIMERTIDPGSRVVISTDTEERSNTANDAGGGVTVASNLPDGAGAADGTSTSQNAETRERVNYEVGETQREVIRAPGAIKRLTVAVLVNGTRGLNDQGTDVFQPRSIEELEALEALVSSAVGYDETRGDVITLRTLEFEPIAEMGTQAVQASFIDRLNIMSLVQMAVLGIVTLLIGLFVVRPIFAAAPILARVPELSAPATAVVSSAVTTSRPAAKPIAGLDGEIASPEELMGLPALNQMGDLAPVNSSENSTQLPTPKDAAARLRNLIEERQEETVEILRGWMNEDQPEEVA